MSSNPMRAYVESLRARVAEQEVEHAILSHARDEVAPSSLARSSVVPPAAHEKHCLPARPDIRVERILG